MKAIQSMSNGMDDLVGKRSNDRCAQCSAEEFIAIKLIIYLRRRHKFVTQIFFFFF